MLGMVILGGVQKVNRSFCGRERKPPFYSGFLHIFAVKVIRNYKVGPRVRDTASMGYVRVNSCQSETVKCGVSFSDMRLNRAKRAKRETTRKYPNR